MLRERETLQGVLPDDKKESRDHECTTDNLWSTAARITSLFDIDDEPALHATLEKPEDFKPDMNERDSIARGIRRVRDHMPLGNDKIFQDLKTFGWI